MYIYLILLVSSLHYYSLTKDKIYTHSHLLVGFPYLAVKESTLFVDFENLKRLL